MDEEPTDEMLKAGVTALLASQVDAASESEIATRVFRAMIREARGKPNEELVEDQTKADSIEGDR